MYLRQSEVKICMVKLFVFLWQLHLQIMYKERVEQLGTVLVIIKGIYPRHPLTGFEWRQRYFLFLFLAVILYVIRTSMSFVHLFCNKRAWTLSPGISKSVTNNFYETNKATWVLITLICKDKLLTENFTVRTSTQNWILRFGLRFLYKKRFR